MSSTKPFQATDAFHVSLDQHLLESLVHSWPRLSVWLGKWESRVLAKRLEEFVIDRPVFVAGLARSGSTILLEAIASHPDVATHQYRDFPGLFTPYWWHELQRRVPQAPALPVERAHGDGLMITPDSPEAFEESLWMAFHPNTRDRSLCQVMDENVVREDFSVFYRDHLRKLLLVRGRTRYASKGNYNVTRLKYLIHQFPDARFIIPVRRPVNHIASLMKQHRLFLSGAKPGSRALKHLRRVGHFEFGVDRQAINTGDDQVNRQIHELWSNGEEVRGWARYWSHLYGWLADQFENDLNLSHSTRVVRFEDLCVEPLDVLNEVFEHTQLEGAEVPRRFAGRIQSPRYYQPEFSEDEYAVIENETAAVAARFGYHESEVELEEVPC